MQIHISTIEHSGSRIVGSSLYLRHPLETCTCLVRTPNYSDSYGFGVPRLDAMWHDTEWHGMVRRVIAQVQHRGTQQTPRDKESYYCELCATCSSAKSCTVITSAHCALCYMSYVSSTSTCHRLCTTCSTGIRYILMKDRNVPLLN